MSAASELAAALALNRTECTGMINMIMIIGAITIVLAFLALYSLDEQLYPLDDEDEGDVWKS